MKKNLLVCSMLLSFFATSWAASTIDSGNAFSWGANIGWMNWRPSAADGVSIGEYICSGYIYGANIGWINLGSGLPVNHIQYGNNSATDFGVNYSIDPNQPGKAILRGLAYGANIGWISFENMGNPRLRFLDGKFEGYAWSANCGWINLGDGSFAVQTDFIAPGLDSDGDGMADAFEFLYFGGLGHNGSADSDGDGMSDLEEYLEGTNPLVPNDTFQIISVATTGHVGNNISTLITWSSNLSRLYAIDTTTDVRDPASWVDIGLDTGPNTIVPTIGTQTGRTVVTTNVPKRFFRVRAIRPLVP